MPVTCEGLHQSGASEVLLPPWGQGKYRGPGGFALPPGATTWIQITPWLPGRSLLCAANHPGSALPPGEA